MKKIVFILGLALIFFTRGTYVSAEGLDIDINDFDHEVVYEDDEITIGSFGNNEDILKIIEESSTSVIASSDDETVLTENEEVVISPFLTKTGPGGVSRLDVSQDQRTIFWSVTPATNWPYIFSGWLELRYFSGYSRNAMISGSGIMGSTTSGYITLNSHRGGTVTLTGTATALNGSNYQVVPFLTTPFAPSR